MIKYGIKIPWLNDGYLWVTEGDAKFQLRPVLYYSYDEAQRIAKSVWGEGAIVAVYEEPPDQD